MDFLRHQRTAYDWQNDQIAPSLFELEPIDEDGDDVMVDFFDDLKARANQVIRVKTLDAIQERFPELAGAISQRQDSAYIVSGGRRIRVGRM